ncbi:hypothetical protein Clacol_004297 [Clathrus columnatus]|uniref:Major facilitator superfamily (MFS) profile domain-containing protein n=1 Tax=Clathrus columnatus TaxID=1419009 RepID=A0AAV5AC57_9AGAM|nr:hypothetical protein Clacol_004297 [Clathrus columnatus]
MSTNSNETTPLLGNHVERTNDSSYTGLETGGHDGGSFDERHERDVPIEQNELLPVGMGVFLAAMDGTIVTSSYAAIGNDLKQLQSSSWLATGYLMTLTSVHRAFLEQLGFNRPQAVIRKTKRYLWISLLVKSRKSCLLFAHVIFGLGCLGCGLARSMPELIAARIFTGIGGGGLTTVVSILVSDFVPLRQRGTWQGVLNIIFSAGSSSGAPLGGIFADKLSWRWSFLFQVPITIMGFFAIVFALKTKQDNGVSQNTKTETLGEKLRRIDFLGAIALVSAVFSLLFGLDTGSNISWTVPLCYISLISSLVLTIAFGFIEATPSLAKEPLAPKRITSNISLIGSYLTNLSIIGVGFGSVFQFALYVQAVKGKSASNVGVYLIPPILAGVSGSLMSGIVMQKTGKYRLLTITSMFFLIIACLSIDTIIYFNPEWGLAALLSCISITTTLVALIANVPPEDQAIATAVSYLFRSLGGVIGISVGSAVAQQTLRAFLERRLEGENYDIEKIIREVRESLTYIDTYDPVLRDIVKSSYGQASLSAFGMITGLAVLGFIASMLIKEKSLDTTPK